MATRTSKTNATKSTNRRTGRPTNVERAARLRSQADQFVTIAAASYAQGMRDALAIEGGIQTVAALAPSVAQGSQAASAATATTSQPASQKPAPPKVRQAPGRRVQEDSNMSKTRRFYAENLASPTPLNRADFVREAAKRFEYTPQTANTYVSNIEREGGYKLARRGGNSGSRVAPNRGTRASKAATSATLAA